MRVDVAEVSGILEPMWWLVGMIVLTVLGLSSALVAFVFRRSTVESETVLGVRSVSEDVQRRS